MRPHSDRQSFGHKGDAIRTAPASDRAEPYQNAELLIRAVCSLAGSLSLLNEIDEAIGQVGLLEAIASGDTPPIFDWLLAAFSFQGISDQVAWSYMVKHGSASWSAMHASLDQFPGCPKLQTFGHYAGCRYDKGSFTCAEPDHIDTCAVPRPRLRNGRLNQTAASFFLFVRDVAGGDLIGWIDNRLETATGSSEAHLGAARQEALVGPLRAVFGVADKILTMALSSVLIGARNHRPLWFETGKAMIAVDTLVHNFLHRTGIAASCGVSHRYGPACYAGGGCTEIIRRVADRIDARPFNATYPQIFPRFVQHAIWRFCSAEGLDLCNGNRIDDTKPCQISYCQLIRKCARKPLKMMSKQVLKV